MFRRRGWRVDEKRRRRHHDPAPLGGPGTLDLPSLVIRDLRVLAQPLDGRVLHYRDNYGVEIDAIVELVDGRWAAFEIKLGAGLVEEGARALLRFRDAVDTRRTGEPAMLGVIAGTGFGYMRPDGIGVIPVGALAP